MHNGNGDHSSALLALRQRQLREQRVGEVCNGLLVCARRVLLRATIRHRLSELGCALLLGLALQFLVDWQRVAADRTCVVLHSNICTMSAAAYTSGNSI